MENELENIKLSSEGSENKFLFFVEPKNIENECIGGISLANGIIIFAVISLLQAINSFMEIFERTIFLDKIGYIILASIFLLIAFCSLFGALKDNVSFLKISYWLSAILFILAAIKYICKSLLKIIEFINPWDGDFLQLDFVTYIFGKGVLLFIYLYFIWIIFCYMSNNHKNN